MDEKSLTRADLVELLATLKQELKLELKQEIRRDTEELLALQEQRILDRTQEMVRDAQTEMLKAFLSYQETSTVRFRALEAKQGNIGVEMGERMEILERRLSEIEKRLIINRINPPAA